MIEHVHSANAPRESVTRTVNVNVPAVVGVPVIRPGLAASSSPRNRVDARLRKSHELPLALFESLLFISRARGYSMRVGDLARALRVTVGGTSKLVDRIERAGLIAREPDPDDRRALRVALTVAGKRKLTAAVKTYEAEVAGILGGALSPEEQQQMRDYVSRLLTSIDDLERT